MFQDFIFHFHAIVDNSRHCVNVGCFLRSELDMFVRDLSRDLKTESYNYPVFLLFFPFHKTSAVAFDCETTLKLFIFP